MALLLTGSMATPAGFAAMDLSGQLFDLATMLCLGLIIAMGCVGKLSKGLDW